MENARLSYGDAYESVTAGTCFDFPGATNVKREARNYPVLGTTSSDNNNSFHGGLNNHNNDISFRFQTKHQCETSGASQKDVVGLILSRRVFRWFSRSFFLRRGTTRGERARGTAATNKKTHQAILPAGDLPHVLLHLALVEALTQVHAHIRHRYQPRPMYLAFVRKREGWVA